MPFAKTSFEHLDLVVTTGDELPKDHPMVQARPDLFQKTAPKAKPATPKKEAD